MSKRNLKVSKDIAKKNIEAQIYKGKELHKSGMDIIEPTRSMSSRDRDNFESKFKQWVGFSYATLYETFSRSSYALDFEKKRSSIVKHVGSNWNPDINYYLKEELLPKIDFLNILLDNLNDFVESSSKQDVSKSSLEHSQKNRSTENKDNLKHKSEDFEKITFPQLLKILSIKQIISIVGFIVLGSFWLGYNVHSWKLDKDKKDLEIEVSRLKSEIKNVKKSMEVKPKINLAEKIKKRRKGE